MTSTSDSHPVTAAEAARILGVTRARVVELAGAEAGFPAAEPTATGGCRWPLPAEEPPLPAEWDPAPGLELALNPDGRDPRRRRPWGSAVFVDDEGRTIRHGLALRQYFIDGTVTRSSPPTAGRCICSSTSTDEVRDAEGRSVGPVEIPPGCRVKAAHERS
jgi:hypothetical protein